MEIIITVPLLRGNLGEGFGQQAKPETFFPPRTVDGLFDVLLSRSEFATLQKQIRRKQFDSWTWHQLARTGYHLSCQKDWQQLLCPRHLADRWRKENVVAYPHQLDTLHRVVNIMRGRAILADEVGLGKTIEAGMILKEYILRGLVQRVLILTPSSLCWQWYEELRDKFGIITQIQRHQFDWEHSPQIIASIDTAKRQPHRDIVLGIDWDMVIVDEAHRLKNSRTANWQFVNQLSKKYFLLLTATPVQNDLRELYNLITLLKPGQLGSYKDFQRRYVADKRTPNNTAELRRLLSQVMVRNRRGQDTVQFTKRNVQAVPIKGYPEEIAFYRAVTDFVQEEYHRSTNLGQNRLALITLQREACSSPWAAAVTLDKMRQVAADPAVVARLNQLIDQAMAIETTAKLDKVVELAQTIGEKVLVFTEYRASLTHIRQHLEAAGLATLGFDGSLSKGRKEWSKFLFQQYGDVLVSTESGGEGLNFQFCHHLINFDLPWNPMRVEQRIGRVHRLGQTHDVEIYNFATLGTIEEHIVYLLQEKINMFEMVIGELDAILHRLDGDHSLETRIMNILSNARDEEDLAQQIDSLGDQILKAKSQLPPSIIDTILLQQPSQGVKLNA
ncbi:MAG: DEAD/DEAH box helicase [Firmicutes bacterium]|nr:DEAD/DEAH box helicase [Bacillota bacterium]